MRQQSRTRKRVYGSAQSGQSKNSLRIIALVGLLIGFGILAGATPLATVRVFGDLNVNPDTVQVTVTNGIAVGVFDLENPSEETHSYVVWSRLEDSNLFPVKDPFIAAGGNISPDQTIGINVAIGDIGPGVRYVWKVDIWPDAEFSVGGNTIHIEEEFSYNAPVTMIVGFPGQTDFTYNLPIGPVTLNWGDTVTLEAFTTDPNNEFQGWEIIGQIRKDGRIFGSPGHGTSHGDNPITFEILSDIDALGAHGLFRFPLTIFVIPEGAESLVSRPAGTTFFDKGEVVTVVSQDSDLFIFDRYELVAGGRSTSSNPEISVTMDRVTTLNVFYDVRIRTFLTIISSPGGTTNPPPSRQDFKEPTMVTITAIPDSGQTFQYWNVGRGGLTTRQTQNPITVNVGGSAGSVSVGAIFEVVMVGNRVLTVSSDTTIDVCVGQTVLPDGNYEHPEGFTVSLLACDDGAARGLFEGAPSQTWYVDGEQASVSNSITILMDRDKTVDLRDGAELPASTTDPERSTDPGPTSIIPGVTAEQAGSSIFLIAGVVIAAAAGIFLLSRKRK